MKGAMTESLLTWDPKDLKQCGIPSPELINVYWRWGEGGFGVILTGSVMIEYDHLEAAGNPIIPIDEPAEGGKFEASVQLEGNVMGKRESSKKREAFFFEFVDMITLKLKKTKVYVVGGLRTTSAMVKALDSVHCVSLARSVTHEFDLPKKILEGRVKSAIQYKFDEQDFGITNLAAGTQIRLVGQDKEPLDLSQDKYKDIFMQSVQMWSEKMADNKDGSKYGYVDIEGVELRPFGAAYPA